MIGARAGFCCFYRRIFVFHGYNKPVGFHWPWLEGEQRNPMSFLEQGAAVDPSRVIFKKASSDLPAYCRRPARADGQYCKHRCAILGGEPEGIVSGNEAQVQTVANWLVASNRDTHRHRERIRERQAGTDESKKNLGRIVDKVKGKAREGFSRGRENKKRWIYLSGKSVLEFSRQRISSLS
jgi:hypothetical protein